ncbi:MAG: NADH-quinone oxidoreductase subunit NuoG [Actinomycetota bacterium]|nr:NADH-quinone oxidoreductase subunit NuoG [Actinomycetota bacterium]
MSDNGLANVTINGHTVKTQPGRTLIDVAEEIGVYVPRFCYHPGMRSVAVCRMCLVQIEGQRKLMPACATPVTDGMVVNSVDPQAVDAQSGMLEFLLINHPLDCPICDRAGECPLQDQTYRHGPGSSRYVEEKRTFEKALEISSLVVLDRERCVLCWRCVRFSDEIAGDQFIQLVDRGPGTQILTFADEPFDSYFSGNTIQICPVGALTSKPYRFVSRPWNLQSAPSVCAYCSVGCPISNESRSDKLVRVQALPNENVNDFWICDKGRFGYHYVDSEERLTNPLIRSGGEFEGTSWGAAVQGIAEKLKDAGKVGVIAGGHLTTEDAWAIAKLAKKTIKTSHVDSRIQDAGVPYEKLLEVSGVAGSTATMNDLDDARTILWIGPDPKETLPVLYLRLRKAVLDSGAKLIVVAPRRMSLDGFATHVIRCEPHGEATALANLASGGRSPGGAGNDIGDPLIVCWGPASPGRDEAATLDALFELAGEHETEFLVGPPHAGSQGMIDMGVYPALDAGYVPVSDPGMDTRAILEAAASGELDALVVFGADLTGDFPDAGLVQRALDSDVYLVVVELFPTDTATRADVLLPSAAYSERTGTFTNLERRIQRLEPLNAPPGGALEPWRVCARIASALGDDWGVSSFDQVWEAIQQDVPTHDGISVGSLTQPSPPTALNYETGFASSGAEAQVAGPGGGYPKGHRSGAPFQTGQNWPLSWEIRAFEAGQRPGIVPSAPPRKETAQNGRSPAPAVTAEDGTLALYTQRFIYDQGTMVSRSKALKAIAKRPFIEMHPDDAASLELTDGGEAIVRANGTQARLRVVVADIARGAVFIPYDQDGLKANSLISGMDPRVEVTAP